MYMPQHSYNRNNNNNYNSNLNYKSKKENKKITQKVKKIVSALQVLYVTCFCKNWFLLIFPPCPNYFT